MRFRPCLSCLTAALALALGAAPVSAVEKKAVLELFTSQGCSSCPKADKLLGELAESKGIIALSLSVDYWDYLGWRDTLALHAHSKRQKGYAVHRGDRQVYTPQMVINGAAEAIGNDRAAIAGAVAAAGVKSALAVSVSLKAEGGNIEVDVGDGAGPAASLWILSVTKRKPVAIERGENRGKTIVYSNVVRSWTQLGEWTGRALHLTLAIADLPFGEADNAAVILQSGTVEAPGPIRGAAMIALR